MVISLFTVELAALAVVVVLVFSVGRGQGACRGAGVDSWPV